MDMNDTGEYSTLDNIRLSEGTERCRAVLREAYEKSAEEAAALLNDRDIRFASLFLLLPEIASMELYPALDEINNTAIELIRQIQEPKEQKNRVHDLSVSTDAVYSAMKWMLMTGAAEDGLCDGYEKILDVAASVLVNTYKDKSVLPVIDELIFRRQKEQRNIHALVWALFRINDPDALRQVAGHFLSEDEEESAFARKLLHAEQQERYENYIQWLEDNTPFLYFTDESFQYASEPVVCKIDYERKYLQKGNSLYKKTPIKPLAKTLPSPEEIETGSIQGGFAHGQTLALADKVVDAVKSGAIKKFFVMAGCDGRMKSRDYYAEFASKLPKDTVILTAGCAKYRYNKLGLGDIGGIPRVLDAGQCNDSYSLAVIALKLKEAFGLDDINQLPIAFNIAWYEQKAVIVLLALLYLGVKNIHLGPTLPGFLSPNVAKVLVENFGIAGIGTADDDIALFMNA